VEERAFGEARGRVIKLSLAGNGTEPLSVLCLGAHADDIEIGCGGTLLYLAAALPQIRFRWVVLSTPGTRRQEAEAAAAMFAGGRDVEIVLKDFRDGFFPYSGAELKEFFEELKGQLNPDLIFTPWRQDAHQDHRVVAELAWNTFRNHMILEYEIPKYDGDLGRPNVFVPLEAPFYEQKINHLLDAFTSQRSKPWFARETFLGLMRIRGMESNAPSGYAEAFHARKMTLQAGY
jgi:LmbE family N-acetylglucosaminyl deacetylase